MLRISTAIDSFWFCGPVDIQLAIFINNINAKKSLQAVENKKIKAKKMVGVVLIVRKTSLKLKIVAG